MTFRVLSGGKVRQHNGCAEQEPPEFSRSMDEVPVRPWKGARSVAQTGFGDCVTPAIERGSLARNRGRHCPTAELPKLGSYCRSAHDPVPHAPLPESLLVSQSPPHAEAPAATSQSPLGHSDFSHVSPSEGQEAESHSACAQFRAADVTAALPVALAMPKLPSTKPAIKATATSMNTLRIDMFWAPSGVG